MANIFGDLIDSFTGAGAKRALQEGQAKSLASLAEGRDASLNATRTAGTEARGYQRPFADMGGRGFELYGDSLGVNGTGARERAQGLYNSDEMISRQRDLDMRRLGRTMNASGSFNSGAAALADSRARLEGYGNWQNRLAGYGQQGQQAAGTMSNIASNEGNALAGIYGGYGRDVASTYGQNARDMAQASNAFAQNVIGLGQAAVSAYTGMPMKRPGSGANNLSGYAPTYGYVNPNNNDPAFG
jgi:hypothetical protein